MSNRSTFHVRIRVSSQQAEPLTEPKLARELIACARRRHDLGHWWCELFLLMPDHLHAILVVSGQTDISESISSWKRNTALIPGVGWQESYLEQRLRGRSEADEKWWYVRHNPVAKGLCDTEDDWPCWWSALSPMS